MKSNESFMVLWGRVLHLRGFHVRVFLLVLGLKRRLDRDWER
jgi:hypothetical protein